jgi:hypothetical protein
VHRSSRAPAILLTVLLAAIAAMPSTGLSTGRPAIGAPLEPPTAVAGSVAQAAIAAAERSLAIPASTPLSNSSAASNWSTVYVRPPARTAPGLAYDPALGGVLMYGGSAWDAYGASLQDTWLFQNSTWTQLHPDRAPPASYTPAMVYDASDGYVLILWPDALNSSWAFEAGDWTPLNFSSGPEWRQGEAVAYDSTDQEVVVFGGENASYGLLNDTWTLRSGLWTRVATTSAPTPRDWARLNDDPWDDGALLVGGNLVANDQFPPTSNETWIFQAGAWTRLLAPLPPINASSWTPFFERYTPWTAPDPAADAVALVAPCDNQTDCGPNYGNFTTWTFSNGTWQEPATSFPTNEWTEGATADWADSAMLAVIETTREPYSPVTFGSAELSQAGWRSLWEPYSPYDEPFTNPPPSWPMTYDAADGYVLMVGGWDFWNGTHPGAPEQMIYYAFHNGGWSRLATTPGPTPRWGESLAYDSEDGYVLMFGGEASGGAATVTVNTWTFRGGTWTPHYFNVSGTEPAARTDAALVDDPAAGQVILFGGANYTSFGNYPGLNDTWAYDDGAWTRISSTDSPAPRVDAAAAYDPAAGEVVLFGGENCTEFGSCLRWFSDTWTYSDGNWTNISTDLSSHPAPRAAAAMAADPADGGVLLFGGEYGELQPGCCGSDLRVFYSDTWRFNGSAWANVTARSSDSPSAWQWPSLADDTGDGYLLYFGTAVSGAVGDGLANTNAISYGQTWKWAVPSIAPFSIASLAIAPSPAEVGSPLTVSFGTLGGAAPFTYGYGGLPSGCPTFTGEPLVCTPTSAGSFTVRVWATDSTGRVASESEALTVASGLGGIVLRTEPSRLPVNRSATFNVTWDGGLAPFQVQVSDLPPGCAAASAPEFSCVPTAAGSYSAEIFVNDSLGVSAQASAIVTVYVPAAAAQVELASSADPILAGTPVNFTTTVTVATDSPLSYEYTGLPRGCASVNASTFSCAPVEAGTFDPEVVVRDPLGDLSTATFTLTVLPQPALSVAAFYASPSPVDIGSAVSIVAIVQGGVPPVSINVTGLPPGCPAYSDSTVSCQPTAAGTYALQMVATDAAGTQVTAPPASLVVSALVPPVHSPPPHTTSNGTGTPWLVWVTVATAGFLAGAAVVTVVLMTRRSRSSPP